MLAGKAQFSVDELDEMKAMLRDRKLPEFGAVGDFLNQVKPKGGDDMGAVNDAIDKEVRTAGRGANPLQNAEELLAALKKASVLYVDERLGVEYLQLLMAEKKKEENNAVNRVMVQQAVVSTNGLSGLSLSIEFFRQSRPQGDTPPIGVGRLLS